jgi:tetratricopeptide (TPR) repeat protein
MTAHARMLAIAIAAGLAAAPAVAADKVDALARARMLYNQRQFEAAVTAADEARSLPGRADSADLIAARAYLERFRDSAAADDLGNARERLRRLNPQRLPSRERVELIVGLGETLFFEGSYGAAADIFDSVLARSELGPDARERALDWWATAIDREARPRTELERQPLYARIREHMERELREQPSSAVAAYWLAAAARGQGDLQAAWDAAFAAWVRSPLAPDEGETLRADIDRLVVHALVPERAKATAQEPEALREEWERFKERWKK